MVRFKLDATVPPGLTADQEARLASMTDPEIAAAAREVFIMLRQSPRAFVEKLDFVTSVGHGTGGDARRRLGLTGAGPTRVITDLGVLSPHPVTRELQLTARYEGVTIERVRKATGWPLLVADEVESLSPPTETELEILRDLQERTRLAHAG